MAGCKKYTNDISDLYNSLEYLIHALTPWGFYVAPTSDEKGV